MPAFRFRGALHDPRTATAVGRLLGAALLTCFVTGVLSHVLQEPPHWLADHLPTRPVAGYRFTQGLHVAAGIAAIPLLLVKLWTVYPRLFVQPPLRGVRHALERLSVAVLVSTALLQLLLGLVNTTQWYPWPFSFRDVHWALAWALTGSLLLHIAVKLPQISSHWRRTGTGTLRLPEDSARDRRSLLLATGAAVGAVTVTTVGQAVPWLRQATLLAPRRPDIGPQGLPVNRTAAEAQVSHETVRDWKLTVTGPRGYVLSLPQLHAIQQHTVELPIACVEGWSMPAHWHGVRVRNLLALADAPSCARLRIVSLQQSGAYAVTEMGAGYAQDPLTLLALQLNGSTLRLDHGYPARIIAPNRPGVLQTKWVHRIEVLE
ncbi:molybdopterin-dependent oxidoreductase [Streptomyces sp. HNM0574]|uniref:molybdopterin-dependent oxidoreductase n=1 Tax=Streptomyces sp. HNM0574 TaxID=2714954 RepID=UPI00146C0F15|nr:molybdopterin-dependent oxidoreductase [Streptomyces sp. HNM0574]NLU68712.1 molybdopterin-dependent oxidoreductase [Streptomyces sp. HNM0574]